MVGLVYKSCFLKRITGDLYHKKRRAGDEGIFILVELIFFPVNKGRKSISWGWWERCVQ